MVWQRRSRKPGSAWMNLRERQSTSTSQPQPSAHVPQPHWTTRAGPWTMCWLFAGSHNHRHDHRSVNTDIWSLEDKCVEFKQKAHTHAGLSLRNTFIMFFKSLVFLKHCVGNEYKLLWVINEFQIMWCLSYDIHQHALLVCVPCPITHSSWFNQCCVDTRWGRRHPAANHQS